jgi:hypothetical protein
MNDKTVINTILKIHFIIVSFLSFIFLTLFIVFIVLQNGIYIDDLSVPNLKIKKLYIKWNKKLNITVDEIKIVKKKETEKSIDYKEINKKFKQMALFDEWFEQIVINKITFNEISGSFQYIDGQHGFLNASSPNFLFKSSLFFESKLFHIKIDKFHEHKRKIDIKGDIIFDSENLELTSSLKTTINNEIFLNILLNANKDKLFYKINAPKEIKSIVHAVDMFNLNKKVRYWIVDAIDTNKISLKKAYGWLKYTEMDKAYKNFYADAVLKNLNYTYNKKLDAIHTQKTEVEFKDGVLNIRPDRAYTYDFFLNKSWLKIDFTKKEELLTLYLIFEGFVNKDLLNLLNTYKIKLPILQNSGTVDTNLKLTVNLRTIDVEAHGDFFSKKANFKYLGLDIDVVEAYVTLDNFDVKIKNMLSKYKNIATAKVDVKFNAKHKKGIIDFKVKKINFDDIKLSLIKQKNALDVSYSISPKQDMIKIGSSKWKFNDQTIMLDKMNVPFNLSKLNATIPITLVKVKNTATAYISGNASLKPNRVDLNVDLLKYSHNKIKLAQSSALLKVLYKNNSININSTDNIRLDIDNFNPILSDLSIKIKNKKIFLNNSNLVFEDIAKIKLNGYYNNNTKIGYLNFINPKIVDKDIAKIITSQEDIKLMINNNNNKTTLSLDKYDVNYISDNKGWKLALNSIDKLVKKSKILQKYKLNNGKMILSKKTQDNKIDFVADIKYPYKLLIKDNKPVEDYHITGKIDENSNDVSLNINDSIQVEVEKDVEIHASNVGINLNAILKYFNDQNSTSTSKKDKNIFLDSENSHLWISETRHVISETINLQYFNNITTAQLAYKDGFSGFKFEDGSFHLYGENFNDKFMQKLFSLSKFKGGNLSFSMNGTTKEYDGIFYIHNTVVLDYKILNNILAFINTIPSLMTFSLPGYNKNGLAVKSAYADFHSKNNDIKFRNIYLDSKEMDIVGRGSLNFKKDKIDLLLNLKTDLGSSVNKIPVVGYILLGDDTISTSLSIKGRLGNPKVKSLIAKEIIVAPLNIIKRTLYAPFNLFKKDK